MSVRSDIEKRIQKLQTETNGLHGHAAEIFSQIEQREFAIQELQAILKTLPKDSDDESMQPEVALRKGSEVAKARDILRAVRQPMHVDHLLPKIGKEVNKKNKASLAGQIAIYVRKGQIFTKTEPNTFGLREWELNGAAKKELTALSLDEVNGEDLSAPNEPALLSPDDDSDALPLSSNDARSVTH